MISELKMASKLWTIFWNQKWISIRENNILTASDTVHFRWAAEIGTRQKNPHWFRSLLPICENDFLTANGTVHLRWAAKIGPRRNNSYWFCSPVFYPSVKAIIQWLHHKFDLFNMDLSFLTLFLSLLKRLFCDSFNSWSQFWNKKMYCDRF